MSIFGRQKPAPQVVNNNSQRNNVALAELALNMIHDGVVITDRAGVVGYVNPAALSITNYQSADNMLGISFVFLFKIEDKDGSILENENENPLAVAIKTNQALEGFECQFIQPQTEKRIPVAITITPAGGAWGNHVITFRDITKDLEEEGAQAEFISTASHEMRTPVASIEGYLSLALNPQTATIDDRAKQYLTAAHDASQHLGHLFRDLLDVTKLDDGRIKPIFSPVDMVSCTRGIYDMFKNDAAVKKINYAFGNGVEPAYKNDARVEQVVYGYVDQSFYKEILSNLIENAIKYTPDNGSIWVNVVGDGDRVLINVTDTGIGISADDAQHIFQKFYRADNSQTRTIGGTGLGLYLVKQRVEAMGGRVWVESAFSKGSTFYVSLPRITSDEYEKRLIEQRNREAVRASEERALGQQVQAVADKQAPPSLQDPTQANQQINNKETI